MSKRINDMQSPVSKWRMKVWKNVSAYLSRLTANQRFWGGFAILSLLTTILIHNPFWRSTGERLYSVGDIARETIISPADISFVDKVETERVRQIERDAVRPMFAYETNRADEAVQNFRSAWERMQRKKIAADGNSNSQTAGKADAIEMAKIFASRKFSSNELEAITRLLREHAGGDIYADQDKPFLDGEILIFNPQKPTDLRTVKNPSMTMKPLSAARDAFQKEISNIRSISETEAKAFNDVLAPLIQPSLSYDKAATEMERASKASSVKEQAISLKRSQTVVREGEVISSKTVSEMAAIRNYASTNRQLNRFLGLLALISALFWAGWKFIEHRGVVQRLALSEQKTFALFGFVVVSQAALMAVFFRMAEFTASQNIQAPYSDPGLWSFAIPFAFGSLLMNLLADRRTALFTGVFTALLAGVLATRGLEFAIFATLVSSVSVYGIGSYRSRQTVTIAGVLVGVAAAGFAVAMIAYTQQPFILNTLLLAVACGLASGMITAAATAVFLPLCETLFGILTDVKLLELSNADLPVLGQLAMRAPGTNQHSHAVGQLSEEACRVVGANGLLARIGALYHDIGKSAAPEHFVENQAGKNPHDRLKPAQSAKIIISHVTYGIKLGKEMGLPQRIIDFIPQHHGTRTLHYFLKKAQAEMPEGEEFDENDFRYPGPKPQFKEAAIMMIADSCEAAARSLAEPTQENIRFIVTKIIDAIVSDDQLDECDLTLRELTLIREAMIKALVAIYHSRVDYPGYTPPNSTPRALVSATLDSEERGMKYTNPDDIPISRGGEIEDEALYTTADKPITE